jgi:hypothetical protein
MHSYCWLNSAACIAVRVHSYCWLDAAAMLAVSAVSAQLLLDTVCCNQVSLATAGSLQQPYRCSHQELARHEASGNIATATGCCCPTLICQKQMHTKNPEDCNSCAHTAPVTAPRALALFHTPLQCLSRGMQCIVAVEHCCSAVAEFWRVFQHRG